MGKLEIGKTLMPNGVKKPDQHVVSFLVLTEVVCSEGVLMAVLRHRSVVHPGNTRVINQNIQPLLP